MEYFLIEYFNNIIKIPQEIAIKLLDNNSILEQTKNIMIHEDKTKFMISGSGTLQFVGKKGILRKFGFEFNHITKVWYKFIVPLEYFTKCGKNKYNYNDILYLCYDYKLTDNINLFEEENIKINKLNNFEYQTYNDILLSKYSVTNLLTYNKHNITCSVCTKYCNIKYSPIYYLCKSYIVINKNNIEFPLVFCSNCYELLYKQNNNKIYVKCIGEINIILKSSIKKEIEFAPMRGS